MLLIISTTTQFNSLFVLIQIQQQVSYQEKPALGGPVTK